MAYSSPISQNNGSASSIQIDRRHIVAKQRILMLVGDYAEDYEVMVPYQMLLMVGHEVHTACPGKQAGDTIATAIRPSCSRKRQLNIRPPGEV